LLLPLVRWDAYFYLALARQGYPPPREGPIYHVAFFPLYPLLVRALDQLFHSTVVVAVLLSNLCALGAALLLSGWGAPRYRHGMLAALLFLCSPGAHFMSLPYTEGLFALLLVGSLALLRRERFWAAASLGALASATRSAGVVVSFLLLFEAWRHRGSLRALIERCLAAVWALAGLAAYAAYCAHRYGDPLAFQHVMGRWGRHLSLWGPVHALFAFNVDPDTYLVALAALAALYLCWRRRVECRELAGAAFLVFLPLSTGLLKGFIRYQSTNAPLLLGTSRWLRGRALGRWLGVSGLLLLYEMFRFAAGYANN
jgi:hypothetical protein